MYTYIIFAIFFLNLQIPTFDVEELQFLWVSTKKAYRRIWVAAFRQIFGYLVITARNLLLGLQRVCK